MADVQPLRALHYDQAVAGRLQDLVAPPYDVIDPPARAALQARSPHNVVAIDLPQGDDPYADAAATLQAWIDEGAIVRDPEPAIWALVQHYTAPDGRELTRNGFLARVRVEDYGPGRIRPHERTHPGPKEDRLRLTRATKANLSPIFSLYSDPSGAAWGALQPHIGGTPWGEAVDDDGTQHLLHRVTDPAALQTVHDALADAELLIADGHHRYETARVYAEEIGGEGDHRYVLMCLVALEDEGLTVFPTHRLVRGTTPATQEALANALRADFEIEPTTLEELAPPASDGPLVMGYLDAHFKQPFRLTLKDRAIADAALDGMPEAYRRLDTAILEALLLTGPLGLTEHDISDLNGFGYARSAQAGIDLVSSGEYDLGFFLRPTPVTQVREVAAAGVSMPPKSTYFFPKVITGMVFNSLVEAS
jgi:uncharacterized protein (DUF1015 family)